MKHGLYGFDKKIYHVVTMFQKFRNMFIIKKIMFQGHVPENFLNQYNIVVDVTKLQNVTQCSWMFEGTLMLTLKLFKNTQPLGEEHYNRIIRFCTPKTYLK